MCPGTHLLEGSLNRGRRTRGSLQTQPEERKKGLKKEPKMPPSEEGEAKWQEGAESAQRESGEWRLEEGRQDWRGEEPRALDVVARAPNVR